MRDGPNKTGDEQLFFVPTSFKNESTGACSVRSFANSHRMSHLEVRVCNGGQLVRSSCFAF